MNRGKTYFCSCGCGLECDIGHNVQLFIDNPIKRLHCMKKPEHFNKWVNNQDHGLAVFTTPFEDLGYFENEDEDVVGDAYFLCFDSNIDSIDYGNQRVRGKFLVYTLDCIGNCFLLQMKS